jgi:chemotaxis protein MotB
MKTSAKSSRSKRRRPHVSAPDEELWLVSYADMMTLLFGFFVILYSFSTLDEKKFSEVSKNMAEALGNKADADGSKDDARLLSKDDQKLRFMTMLVSMMNLGSADDVMAKMQKKADRDAVLDAARAALGEEADTPAEDVLELVLPADELFATGSAELTLKGQRNLRHAVDRLRKVQDLLDVQIECHTDSRPLRGDRAFRNNWALSAARAGAVAEYFARAGIERQKLHIAGLADTKPLFPETTPAGVPLELNRAKNRRIHIILRRPAHDQG